MNTLKPIAKDFFDFLNDALKTEPTLQETYNNIASEHTASNTERTAIGVEDMAHDVKAMRSLMEGDTDLSKARHDYLHWLIERNLYLDLRGIPQTQRQVQVKLEEVYVSLRAQREEKLSAS